MGFHNLEFFFTRLVHHEPLENFFARMFQIVVHIVGAGVLVPPFLSVSGCARYEFSAGLRKFRYSSVFSGPVRRTLLWRAISAGEIAFRSASFPRRSAPVAA